jgi:hypothetical protein
VGRLGQQQVGCLAVGKRLGQLLELAHFGRPQGGGAFQNVQEGGAGHDGKRKGEKKTDLISAKSSPEATKRGATLRQFTQTPAGFSQQKSRSGLISWQLPAINYWIFLSLSGSAATTSWLPTY